MKIFNTKILGLLLLFTLAACNTPEATSVPEIAVVEPTNTAVSTDTPEPTEIPTEVPTNTPEPTNTTIPTDTPEPTETPTEVPTETPEPTETAVPTNTPQSLPTNTAVPVATNPPPAPAALPASGSPPTGPNLLINPGFEYGLDGWRRQDIGGRLFSTDAYPQFVHSGTSAARYYGEQLVENLQPGTTYRLGAWLKVWASDGENREVSEYPGDYYGKVCISDEGTDPPTRYCSGHFRPIDSWQYITVDAVPTSNRVVIILTGGGGSENPNTHVEIMWDDAKFGLSPVVATAVPVIVRPAPPAPVAFDAVAMRDSMNNSRSAIEQMGGLLDRIYNGSRETCQDYDGYYRAVVASPRYDGVPSEWQAVYNEYIGAVEHASNTNLPIFELCFEHGGGGITELNYGAARQGINDSLNRLIPALETANTMLGQ